MKILSSPITANFFYAYILGMVLFRKNI